MKLNETSSNLIKNISEDTKVRPKKKICQKSRATITSRHNHLNISQRSSKLKVLVHKSVSAGSLTRPTLTSTKATNASVPCDPDHLMVKILDTDPSLSDSCLMRTKKFKNSVQKACSCLNDILQQLNDTEIKESSSNCKIQPSNIDLELQRPKMHKFRFFFPRLPSNRDVHNVDKGQVNIESCGSSNTQEAQCQENSEASVCRIPERRQVTFYSPCSNISLSEERNKPTKTVKFEDKVESKVEMKVEGKSDTKVSENEVHLIWPRNGDRKTDFVLAPCFTARKNSVTSCVKGVKIVEKDGKGYGDSVAVFADEKEKGRVKEDSDVNAKNKICEDQFSKDSERKVEGKVEPYYMSTCSSGSLKVCSSKQRSYEHFCSKGVLKADEKERSNVHVHFPKCDLKKQTESSSESSSFEGNTMKLESSVHQVASDLLKKNLLEKQSSLMKPNKFPKNILGTENDSIGAKKASTKEEIDIVGKEDLPRDKINFKTKTSLPENIEKHSVDSTCTPNSDYTDTDYAICSRCGKDFSGSEEATESSGFTSARPITKAPSLEVIKTSTLIITTDTETKEDSVDGNSSTLSPNWRSSSKTHVPNRPDRNSTPSRPSRPAEVDPPQNPGADFSCNCAGHNQKNANNNGYPKVVAFTTRIKAEPERSVSTELESFSKNFRISSSATTAKPGSPHGRSTLKSKLHSLRFRHLSSRSTKDLRNRTTSETRCKARGIHFPALSSYRNRFWRGSIVPGNLCNSFPANSVNQIKRLLRKKLRRLLIEKDRGTCTSKTFLRNDRYFISISSAKLNESRIVGESCCGSNRCPFLEKNRVKADGQGETFSERKLTDRKKDRFEESVKERRQRITKDGEIFSKIRSFDASRLLGQKRLPEPTEWRKWPDEERDCMGDKVETGNEEFPCNCGKTNRRSSVATFGTARMLFLGNDARTNNQRVTESLYLDKMSCNNHGSKNEKFVRNISSTNRSKCPKSSEKLRPRNKRGPFCDVRFEDRNALRSHDSRPLEMRLFDFGEDESRDLARVLSNYEKRINDLSVDFRLKLLQYVALCRRVKDCLVTRLGSDDVCDVSSSSV